MKVLKMKFSYGKPIDEDTPIRDLDAGTHFYFKGYVEDEKGRKGAKFIEEGSSGYDFNYPDTEVILYPGDTYTGSWSYTECDGPSEWEEVMICYYVELVEVDE